MSGRLEVTILGCGSSGGVPRADGNWGVCDPADPRNARTRCSLMVRQPSAEGPERWTTVIVDAAPELRQQAAAAGAKRLDALLMTHDHADQAHGIDDIRAFAMRQRARIPVHVDPETAATMLRRFGYIFAGEKGYPAIADMVAIPPHGEAWQVEGPSGVIPVVTFDQDHGEVRSVGYRFGPVAYSSDVLDLDNAAFAAMAGVELWIVDALRYTPHPTHSHVERTLGWIERLRPRLAVLTNLHIDLDFTELSARLPDGVIAAVDGLRLEIQLGRGFRVNIPHLRLGFLASNNGSGMRAILTAIANGDLDADARLVVSNRRDAPALAYAAEHGAPPLFIPTKADPAAADVALEAALRAAGVELVVLSGYLRKLGPRTLTAYAGRVLNVHPALLPKFGGRGMYGHAVHEAVAASGDAVSGATVHIVDAEYDHGPTLAQVRVPLAPSDDADAIQAKVTAAEPGLLVDVLRRISAGELILPENTRL